MSESVRKSINMSAVFATNKGSNRTPCRHGDMNDKLPLSFIREMTQITEQNSEIHVEAGSSPPLSTAAAGDISAPQWSAAISFRVVPPARVGCFRPTHRRSASTSPLVPPGVTGSPPRATIAGRKSNSVKRSSGDFRR